MRWLAPIVLGVLVTLATSAVRQHTIARYADVEACASGCTVAAAGWPLPWLVDDPGLSPANLVSLRGVVSGVDRLNYEGLALDVVAWALAAWLALALLRRVRR
ncbi:hypothetical protein [Cognatilysobacter lacus]|uniref:Uncharacterized protein n=1 Tax=Cognatilysobacter lacus TaxID=1643323 RepID=A0A5D8Z782_9GAMM|nr:hypothetical protein [Lysobacter lacus]TZF90748.1 hypothetical protein FW784_04120 [Lysobacter lacus]